MVRFRRWGQLARREPPVKVAGFHSRDLSWAVHVAAHYRVNQESGVGLAPIPSAIQENVSRKCHYCSQQNESAWSDDLLPKLVAKTDQN